MHCLARLILPAIFLSMLASGAATAQGMRGVALVVGNSAYQYAGELTNPKNDANDVAAAFESVGFKVIKGIDLDKRAMERTIREFARALKEADAGIFFYAGHGIQVDGTNYLVPIDARLEDATGIDFELVRLSLIQRTMERSAATNLLFLDACRNNPLARNLARAMGTRSASVGSGLATAEAGVGTLISFSTQPGNVALDGTGRNSPFSGALTKHIASTDGDVSELLISVRRDVMSSTANRQVPWEHSALTDRFYFKPPKPKGPSAEETFWSAVKDSKHVAVVETYLNKYPNGKFSALARALAAQLEREQAKEAAAAAKEAELRKAEEAKRRAEAEQREAERRQLQAKQAADLKAAIQEMRRTREELRKAEEARLTAESAAEEARKVAEAEKAQSAALAKSGQQKILDDDAELAFWNSVKDSKHTAIVEAYLAKYPKGHFAALATALIEQLKREQAQEAAAAAREAELLKAQEAKLRAETEQREAERRRQQAKQSADLKAAIEEMRRTREELRKAEEARVLAEQAATHARKSAQAEKAQTAALAQSGWKVAATSPSDGNPAPQFDGRWEVAIISSTACPNKTWKFFMFIQNGTVSGGARFRGGQVDAAGKIKFSHTGKYDSSVLLHYEGIVTGTTGTVAVRHSIGRCRGTATLHRLSPPGLRTESLPQSAPATTSPAGGEIAADAAKRAELLQHELKRVGCYAGAIDGDWGPGSKQSMIAFNRHANATLETDEPTDVAIRAVQKASARICPVTLPDSAATPNLSSRSASAECRLESITECRDRARSLGYTRGGGYCKGMRNRKHICH